MQGAAGILPFPPGILSEGMPEITAIPFPQFFSFRHCFALRLFTPHPGEAARLLGVPVAAIQADRVAAICRLQARYGGYWVLKGHHSLLLGGGRWLCPLGNPGMATGGSGDVLTGILAGLRAQDLEADKALSLGVCLHARAGDLAAAQMGEASLLARDILAAVPRVLQELAQNNDGN